MSLFENYDTGKFYDEMFTKDGTPREGCHNVFERLNGMSPQEFRGRCDLAEMTLINQGITFTVYGDNQGVEKPFPVDLVPRIIPAQEWDLVERGLKQRVRALNLFLHDIYHDQNILTEGIIPRELVVNAPNFRREFMDANVPQDIYIHICGTDLIRDDAGNYKILEDNCRTPSGVSYVLQNRIIMTRVFPHLFRENAVRPVDYYTSQLLANLRALAPSHRMDPTVALLTLGFLPAPTTNTVFWRRNLALNS